MSVSISRNRTRKWIAAGVISVAGVVALFLFAHSSNEISQKGDAKDLIASGWERFVQAEYELAEKEFERAMHQSSLESNDRLQAIYGVATVSNLRRPGEDREQAQRLYRQIVAEAPDDELAGWSLLALARMRLTVPSIVEAGLDTEGLLQDYQKVIDRFPFKEPGEQAFLFQQAVRLEGSYPEKVHSVLDALTAFLSTHPQSPYRDTAISLRAHCYAVMGMVEEQLKEGMKASEVAPIDPLNPVRDMAGTYWWFATQAEFNTGDWDMARHYYRKLIAEYPTDIRIFLAKQELKRMDEQEANIVAELKRETRLP